MLVRPSWLLWWTQLDTGYPGFEDANTTRNRYRQVQLLAPQFIPLATLGAIIQLLHLDLDSRRIEYHKVWVNQMKPVEHINKDHKGPKMLFVTQLTSDYLLFSNTD